MPVASAQTSEKEAAVKGFAEVDAILAGHNDTSLTLDDDYYNVMINYGVNGENRLVWDNLGADSSGSKVIDLVGTWIRTPFNTKEYVDSLTVDSWEEMGCEIVSSDKEVDGVDLGYNDYPHNNAPTSEIYGTSYVRKSLLEFVDAVFSQEEKQNLEPTEIYHSVTHKYLYSADSYVEYTDIYKTNDYVHLPYYQEDAVKDVTIYFGENSADNIASGARSFSLHEWLRFAPVVGQLMRNVAEPRYHDVSHSLAKDGLIWRYQGNDKVAYADDPYATYPPSPAAVVSTKLDISRVLFASSGKPAEKDGEVSVLGAYYLRYKNDNLGEAVITPDKQSVRIESINPMYNGYEGLKEEPVYLYVQYSRADEEYQGHAYAKQVQAGDVITASELTNGDITDFENCKVWLESTYSGQRATYAAYAEQEVGLVLTPSQASLAAIQYQQQIPEAVTFTLTNPYDVSQEIIYFEITSESGNDPHVGLLEVTPSDATIHDWVLSPGESKTFTINFDELDALDIPWSDDFNIRIDYQVSGTTEQKSLEAALHCEVKDAGDPALISVSTEEYDVLTGGGVTYQLYFPQTMSFGKVLARVYLNDNQTYTEYQLTENTDYILSSKTGDITFTLKENWIKSTDWLKDEDRQPDGGQVTILFHNTADESWLFFDTLFIPSGLL